MKKLIQDFKEHSLGIPELKLILYLARNPNRNLKDILENNVFWYPTLKRTLTKLTSIRILTAQEDSGTQNYRSIHYSLNLKNPVAKVLAENQALVERLVEAKFSQKHILIIDYLIRHSTETIDISLISKTFKSVGYSRVVKVMEQLTKWNLVAQTQKTGEGIDDIYKYPFDYTYNPNSEISKLMEIETEKDPPSSILASISNITNNISNIKPQNI